MVRQVEAIFEDGSVRERDAALSNERREEFQWLAKEAGPYAGQWVALDGSSLVAHGTELATVSASANAAGVDRPLLTHLPAEGELPFGGW